MQGGISFHEEKEDNSSAEFRLQGEQGQKAVTIAGDGRVGKLLAKQV